MIKEFCVVAMFFLVAIGCGKEDIYGVVNESCTYSSGVINFESQEVRGVSSDISVMEDDDSGFVVYGSMVGESAWYENLDGQSYIYNSDLNKWEWESGFPLWPEPFKQMNFYSYYPKNVDGFTMNVIAPSTIVGDIEVAPSILDQVDYLASASGDIVAKPLRGVQPLNFTHIMSKISFSVMQDEGVLTVIRQLGIENVINKGSYDYVNSQWYDLSNKNIVSFDDYVGSAGPFAKYGVADQVDPIRIDGHYLMLIPQTGGVADSQTLLWDGSITIDDSGDLVPNGAYVSIRYRTNNDIEDMIGYAFRTTSPNDTEWRKGSYFHSVYKKDKGRYTGPLYVKVGFQLAAEQLNWEPGKEYDYRIRLNKSGGIYLSEYYYDVDGTNTKIRVKGSPKVGDPVFKDDISIGVAIDNWRYIGSGVYPL